MRILIISPFLGDLFGQEQVVRASTTLLRNAGHSVHLLCDTLTGAAPRAEGVEEVRGLSTIDLRTPKTTRLTLHARAKKFIEACQPDVIHLIDQFDAEFVRWMTNKYPVILSAHAVVHTCPAGSRLVPPATLCTKKSGWSCLWHDVSQSCLPFPDVARKAYALYVFQSRQKALRGVHHVAAVSHFIKNGLIANGWPAEQIDTVYNPVFPAARFAALQETLQEDPTPLIAAAARFVPLKGLTFLIQALGKIKDLPWTCKLAGEGPERAALEKQVLQLGIEKRVQFLGRLVQTDVHALFRSARVVVHPSVGPEAFGLAPAEASAAGVPVVSFRVPALDEIIQDRVNGRLVAQGNSDELALVLRELITDSAVARALGKKGPELMAERFSPEMHLKQLEQAYLKCQKRAGKLAANPDSKLAQGA